MTSIFNSINSNSSDMSPGELAEGCKLFGLFDGASSNSTAASLLSNKSTMDIPVLFSTDDAELPTLAENVSPPPTPPLQQEHQQPPPPKTMPGMSMSRIPQYPFPTLSFPAPICVGPKYGYFPPPIMSDKSTRPNEDIASSIAREVQQPDDPAPPPQRPPSVDDDDIHHVDVVVPTKFDVKCGRGSDTIQHNGHFIELCDARVDAYQATRKRKIDGKRGIVMSIVNAIHAKQGRFIRQESGVGSATTTTTTTTTTTNHGATAQPWQVVPLKEAMDKTSHCLRDIVNRKRRKNEHQQLERRKTSA
jgi:hypothetical protein